MSTASPRNHPEEGSEEESSGLTLNQILLKPNSDKLNVGAINLMGN